MVKMCIFFCSLFLLLLETLEFTLVSTLKEVLLSTFEGRELRSVSKTVTIAAPSQSIQTLLCFIFKDVFPYCSYNNEI